ncbi:hypothetical protein F5148DRAFT_602391 [Russula earlei]|uniref:Uncharacterized protein n=1 Tax=Russula earlei TaxID=71964 RepID=A0ACC0TWI9_9AGAM|nr:hypothetical protein F5148DRAFT_602391 [Russula earlei]
MFDYGLTHETNRTHARSPTGFRIAVRHPERVTTIITQNENAYAEGLFARLESFWAAPEFSSTTPEAHECRPFLKLGPTKWHYTNGVPDTLLHRRPIYPRRGAACPRGPRGGAPVADYRTNPKLYPQWQKYLRSSSVPVPTLWGANDVIFVKVGAEAFARDVKDFVWTLSTLMSRHVRVTVGYTRGKNRQTSTHELSISNHVVRQNWPSTI